jgi:phage terminase large subunit-like protein
MTVRERVSAEPFTVEHFARWASRLELDSGDSWEVEPFQEDFVRDVFGGVTVCWLVVPEGNGKTTFVAGLALYLCEFRPFSVIPVAASSREQAEILYRQAEGFVVRTPELYERVDSELARRRGKRTEDVPRFDCLEGYRRINHVNGSRIQVFAADDRTGDGVIPTFAIVEELHRHRSLALYRTWLGKMRKRGGQMVVISTAGEPGGEFEEVRELMRQAGDVEKTPGFTRAVSGNGVLHDWSLDDDQDVEDYDVVKLANPFSGVTAENLREKFELPGMNLAHWRRFTCNLPTRGDSAAISEADWFAARVDDRIPDGESVILGVDLGWKHDTTSIVPLWVRDPEFRLLGDATILEPPRNNDRLDVNLVMAALRDMASRFEVRCVAMDTSFGGGVLGQWVEDELGVQVIEHSQRQTVQAEDYQLFTEALGLGWLKHSGDAGLTRHALNAVARTMPGGQVKFERPFRNPGSNADQRLRVIDALVAAAMAHTVAVEMMGPSGEVMAAFV